MSPRSKSHRDLRLYLDDMIESAERILAYTAGMRFDTFVADFKTYDAVLRNFMVLGEAARNIPGSMTKLSGKLCKRI